MEMEEDMNFEELIALADNPPTKECHKSLDQIPATLKRVSRAIRFAGERNGGFGYCSTEDADSADAEAIVVDLIVGAFRDRNIIPIKIDIDVFYGYAPRILSIVEKIRHFDTERQERGLPNRYAIVLTGFGESILFPTQALQSIPVQENAGLGILKNTEFGKLLSHTSNMLVYAIEQHGSLNALLEHTCSRFGEDGNLFLATCLLLQDRQTWQELWYEWTGSEGGTSLFIVAPPCFHDAMNRLNLSWGHGHTDYAYRATLGRSDQALSKDGEEPEPYHKQGLSSEEFERRMRPILNFIAL